MLDVELIVSPYSSSETDQISDIQLYEVPHDRIIVNVRKRLDAFHLVIDLGEEMIFLRLERTEEEWRLRSRESDTTQRSYTSVGRMETAGEREREGGERDVEFSEVVDKVGKLSRGENSPAVIGERHALPGMFSMKK